MRIAEIVRELDLKAQNISDEERKEHQPLLEAIAKANMEEKLKKRRAKKLDVQYDHCKAAEGRSAKRLADLELEQVAITEKIEKEKAVLQSYRNDLAELARQLKEQYELGEFDDDGEVDEEEEMDTAEQHGTAKTPMRHSYGASDGSWDSFASSSRSPSRSRLDKLELALEQQQLHAQNQFVQIKDMLSALASQMVAASHPQQQATVPARPLQPSAADLAHMHLAAAVPIAPGAPGGTMQAAPADTVPSAESPAATPKRVANQDDGADASGSTRRRASPRSPVPTERIRPTEGARSRAKSAFRTSSVFPQSTEMASTDPY